MFELSFADVKPSVLNWLIVGLMALTFSAAAKFAVNHYSSNPIVSKFKDLVNAA